MPLVKSEDLYYFKGSPQEVFLVNYQLLLMGLLALVIFVVFFSKIIFKVIGWIIKVPILVVDYYILYLFWSKDGSFNRIWIIVFFVIYLAIFSFLFWWLRHHRKLRMLIVDIILFIVPIISILTTNWLAALMKVDNTIVLPSLL